MSTPQQVKDKWMRMMKDKKDVQNEAATGLSVHTKLDALYMYS